jgi:hypothetical protein
MATAPSRYDVNRQVKTVLVRHAVDLTKLGFSYSGRVAHFWGSLKKDPTGNFDLASVETLVRELQSLPYGQTLQFDLDDWNISNEAGTLLISRRRLATSSILDKPLVIDHEEKLEDVLRDITDEKEAPEQET